MLISLFLSAGYAHSAGTWFNGVKVTRVMSGENGIQIWGDKGCAFQSGYASQTVTTGNSSNNSYLSRMMSIALSAQVASKTVSFYADCTTSAIIQICLNNSVLDSSTC